MKDLIKAGIMEADDLLKMPNVVAAAQEGLAALGKRPPKPMPQKTSKG